MYKVLKNFKNRVSPIYNMFKRDSPWTKSHSQWGNYSHFFQLCKLSNSTLAQRLGNKFITFYWVFQILGRRLCTKNQYKIFQGIQFCHLSRDNGLRKEDEVPYFSLLPFCAWCPLKACSLCHKFKGCFYVQWGGGRKLDFF